MTTEEKPTTYNGWANYQTWAVILWLENDRGTYESVLELTRDTISEESTSEYWSVEQSNRYNVADAIKDQVEEWTTDEEMDENSHGMVLAGLGRDLMGYALACVDWHEIADAWIDRATEPGYGPSTLKQVRP